MTTLGPADILGYVSSLVLLAAITFEAIRRTRKDASRGFSPFTFAGHMVAALGFGLRSLLTQDTLFIVISAEMFAVALLGLIVSLPDRIAAGFKVPGTMGRPSRHGRGHSVLVRTGETMSTSAELARALEGMQSAIR